jgi:hypothetical protein
MNCEWLKNTMAFDCVPVRGLHGEEGIEIGTPFSYADGTAIILYTFDQNEHLLLSDNGDMLAHLSSVGIEVRRPQSLRDIIGRFGLTLTEQGDVRAIVPKDRGEFALANAISALLAVAEWERDQLGLTEQTRNLATEAELYLRAWKPGKELERDPKIKGQSRRTYSFDFLLDGEYIDVIPANAAATGASMRKAGDVLNSPNLPEGRSIRFVIDDSDEPQRAEQERQILGSLAKAMLMSRLRKLQHATLQ